MQMLDIYVHQTLIVLIAVKHVRQLAGQTKSWMKKCFICAGKVVKHLSFAQHLTCWLGKCLCCLYMSLSGFFAILLYLVLTIFSSLFLCSLFDIVLEHSFSVYLLSCLVYCLSLCVHMAYYCC